jgi:hypothetical protein
LILAAGLAACGSSRTPAAKTPAATTPTTAAAPIPASKLAASMKDALAAKSGGDRAAVERSLSVSCNGGTVHSGQTVRCSVLATAGRGYNVAVKLACWTATFNGTIIEGPGLIPPPKRPKQSKPLIATTPTKPTPTPTNLPDSFSGCVK